MKLGDLSIDFEAAKVFLRRWSSFELSLDMFTEMLEESTSWHNIPIDVLKTVAYFESGYPQKSVVLVKGGKAENPYRSNFRRKGSVFVGPFQEGDVYLAGVKEFKNSEYYKWLSLSSKTENLSLGTQLYIMIAEKVRLAHFTWRGVGSISHVPMNAGVIYSLHVRPLAAFKFYAGTSNFSQKLPAKIYAGQSAAVDSYFRAQPISALGVVNKATMSGYL